MPEGFTYQVSDDPASWALRTFCVGHLAASWALRTFSVVHRPAVSLVVVTGCSLRAEAVIGMQARDDSWPGPYLAFLCTGLYDIFGPPTNSLGFPLTALRRGGLNFGPAWKTFACAAVVACGKTCPGMLLLGWWQCHRLGFPQFCAATPVGGELCGSALTG